MLYNDRVNSRTFNAPRQKHSQAKVNLWDYAIAGRKWSMDSIWNEGTQTKQNQVWGVECWASGFYWD